MSIIDIVQPKTSKSSSAGSSALSLTLDVAPTPGNYLLLAILAGGNNGTGVPTITPPAGFTQQALLQNNNMERLYLGTRLVLAGDGTVWTGSLSASRRWIMAMFELDDVLSLGAVTTGSGSTITETVSAPAQAQALVRKFAFFGVKHSASFSNPTNGFIERVDTNTGGGTANDVAMCVVDKDYTSVIVEGVSVDYTQTDEYCSAMIVINSKTPPVTYAKAGAVVAPGQISGPKALIRGESGAIKGVGILSGSKQYVHVKTGTNVVSEAKLSGTRPGFYTKTGILKVDGVVSGVGLHLFSATLTRDLTERFSGIASGRVNTQGTGPNQGAWINFVPNRSGKHTVSIYTKATVPLRLRVTDEFGNNITVGQPVEGTGDWQRLVLTTNANLLHNHTYRMYIETVEAVATAYWIDAAQAEARKVVSEYVDVSRPSGQGPVGTALKAAKPAGLIMNYLIIEGQTFRQLRDRHQDFQEVKDVYGTFEDARDDLPILEE